MGCEYTKPEVFQELSWLEMSKLDQISRFEHSFPFYRLRIDVFEGRVKRFVLGRTGVSITQLRFAFKNDKNWKDLEDDNSLLLKILKSEFFKDEKEGLINIYALLLWGLLLCGGDNKMKARVFYDILQDNLQETISAGDKDFPIIFNKLINLATLLPQQYIQESESAGPLQKFDTNKMDENFYEKIREIFLDEVYGLKSRWPRKVYMQLVEKKSNWIFSSQKIREIISKEL